MSATTPLYELHRESGARFVEFGGWTMPLHYGSQVEEHHAVRREAGMFDVSHMGRVDIEGAAARQMLRHLLANDVAKLKDAGRALYSCMLNEHGGVIDDLIVYRLADDRYRAVINAATRDVDMAWIKGIAGRYSGVSVVPRADLAMIAVQGPRARAVVAAAIGEQRMAAALELAPFSSLEVGAYFIGTTGYTGEDGFEIMAPAQDIVSLWRSLVALGVQPCGLGARDTLRLEAGMNLYGADMDESTTPLESGLAWTVAFKPEERDFVGRGALERQRAQGVAQRLAGLLLEERGVLRAHQLVRFPADGRGTVTSGGFSPTLGRSIALARIPQAITDHTPCQVEIRSKLLAATVVKYPFVRFGRSCLD